MSEKHKAIFKGIVKETLWSVSIYLENTPTHRIMKSYSFDFLNEERVKRINSNNHIVDFKNTEIVLNRKELWSGEIYRPELHVGEEIYINDLDIIVKVSRKYRTTNDEVIYETKHIIETVETEKTKESRLLTVESWFEFFYPNYEKFEELKSEFVEEITEITEEPEEVLEEAWKPSWEKEGKKKKSWFSWFEKGGN